MVCIGICLVPIIQMAVVTLLYKLIAAMIQPVSDKRIVGCISSIADGSQMLLRIIFTTGVLFFIDNRSSDSDHVWQVGGKMIVSYQWLQNIAFYLILITAIIQIIPNHSYKKYISFFYRVDSDRDAFRTNHEAIGMQTTIFGIVS